MPRQGVLCTACVVFARRRVSVTRQCTHVAFRDQPVGPSAVECGHARGLSSSHPFGYDMRRINRSMLRQGALATACGAFARDGCRSRVTYVHTCRIYCDSVLRKLHRPGDGADLFHRCTRFTHPMDQVRQPQH